MDKLTENDQNTILEKIDCFYGELVGKYEEEKYNEQEYTRLCSVFKKPSNVDEEAIECALAWKYGKTRENLRKNPKYENIIKAFKTNWKTYVKEDIKSGDDAFNFWNEKINSSFISIAFIAHLIFPADIPIVDQHTFRSVRYFLGVANYKHGIKRTPNSLSEIHRLKDFVHYFSKAKNVSLREFDKYLMMFGKHVAPS